MHLKNMYDDKTMCTLTGNYGFFLFIQRDLLKFVGEVYFIFHNEVFVTITSVCTVYTLYTKQCKSIKVHGKLFFLKKDSWHWLLFHIGYVYLGVFLQNNYLETADVSWKTTSILYSFQLPENIYHRKINKYITCLDAESLRIRFKVLKNE